MWDDVIIGKKNRHACSATGLRNVGDISISQNQLEYWISNAFFGRIGMTIEKATDSGRELTALLKDNASDTAVCEFLTSLYVPNVSIRNLMESIERYGESRYNEGLKDKAREFRKVLDI